MIKIELEGIKAELPKGEIIGLVGPDGAGKTTLLRLMAGLFTPGGGSISIDDHDTVKETEAIHQMIGYMPQRFGLYEDLTVMENLELYADLRGVVGEEKEKTFEKLLQFTNLAPFTDRLAGKLSGGMKQKLGLACALIKKPQVLLLDEPSVGVDPLSRRELWKIVYQLVDEGITVVWSTAYLDEAEKCKQVLLLNSGKLLYYGDPSLLTKRVEGRVFTIPRKDFIPYQKGVIDAVNQGKDVRVVLSEKGSLPGSTPIKPRFEDGFIDILGGSALLPSPLAKLVEPVKSEEKFLITAEGLIKKFGSFVAVDNVSFTVEKGKIFGLLGPNGAGKSTIFKMLCGLLHPTQGKAYVNGVSLEEASSLAKSQIGYMAQKFSLYGALSVRQNLEFFAGIYGLEGTKKREAVDEMVKIFALEPFLSTSAEKLPLGFKQRLALACSNMHHPKILFLDEPTSGVDPLTRREFWNHINGLVEKGVTIMITTHFMEEAEYCDQIALIYRGKIIRQADPTTIKGDSPTLEDAFITLIKEYDGEK